MKIYEILDEETKTLVGTLLYYEKERSFVIELADSLDEWNAPLLFTNLVKKGIYTMPRDLSFLWVKERIIPSGRQNIGDILNNHKLKEYDEMKFLELASGRCSQDSLYIKKAEKLPEYVIKRQKYNLKDCTVLTDFHMLCFFNDGTTRKISLKALENIEGVDKVVANAPLFASAELGTDGYFISFDNSIDIPAWALYKEGQKVPLTYDDFLAFAKNNLEDTSSSCEILECSRQNLAYMVKENQLSPFKENVKGNLYLRKDVVKNRW